MANEVDLIQKEGFDTSWDDVVIEKLIRDIPGGRSLDVSGLADDREVIQAGHVILRDDLAYKAMPTLTGGGYSTAALTGDWEVCGVLYRTIAKDAPFAPIMTRGVVNEKAMVESGAPDYADLAVDVKEALPLIEFVEH